MYEIKTGVGALAPASIWKEREDWLQMQNKSMETWEKMDADQRETVITFVTHGIQELLENIEEWIPFSLSVDEGKFLEVKFRLIMASLEAHQEEMKKVTETQIQQAAEGAAALLGELENER